MTLTIPVAKPPAGETFLYHIQKPRENLIEYIEHLAQQGDILEIKLGPTSLIYINHPDLVRDVLVTQAMKFHKPKSVKRSVEQLIGYNLFSTDGDTWRVLRKSMSPAFHTQRIHAYLDIMADFTEQMIAGWSDDETVEIPDAMMDVTMGITTKTLFDVDLRDQQAGEAILTFLNLFNERISNPLALPTWVPTKSNRQLKAAIEIGDDLLQPIIEERRATGEDHGDLLSMLLIAQREDNTGILTDHQVRNEINNLFAAGYEVVAHTAGFTLYLVSQHPAVEKKLFEEIDTILGDRRVTIEDLPKLVYLEQVIEESMRLLPVTTVLGRQAVEETTIGEGYPVKNGSPILIAPWTLHRLEEFYPEPERFDPERFSPQRRDSIPKHGYIPFSTGPRICIGNAFAMMQLKANLATIWQRYRLSTTEDYQFEPVFRFNTRPKNGLPMVLHQRDVVRA